jgi:hypothetical protein
MTRQFSEKQVKRAFDWRGLSISIECEAGEVRFNKPLESPYGFINETMGEDGEPADCYLGTYLDTGGAFKVTQLKPDGSFDEYKYMLGFEDIEQAEAAYKVEMPAEFFGGIEQSNAIEIAGTKEEKFKKALDKDGYVVMESVTFKGEKRAKLVRSRVAPGWGQKLSENQKEGLHRFYNDESVVEVVKELQALIRAGVPVVNRLGHVQKNQHFNDNPPISLLKWIDINELGEVICDDEFFQDEEETPLAVEWSKRAYRKEYLPRSWEARSTCEHPGGFGECDPLKLFCVAWLDPAGSEPGFGPEAKVTEILETFEDSHCKGSCNGKCRNCRAINNFEAGSSVGSGGNNTKGANMPLSEEVLMTIIEMSSSMEAAIAKLEERGADDAQIGMAVKNFREKGGTPTPADIPMENFDKKVGEAISSFEQKFTATLEEKFLKKYEGQFISETERKRLARLDAQELLKEEREKTVTDLFEAITKPALGRLDLTDHNLYPKDSVMKITKEVAARVTEEGLTKNEALICLEERIAVIGKNTIPAPATAVGENGLPTFEFKETDPAIKVRERIREASRNAKLARPGGHDEVDKADKLRERHSKTIHKIVNQHDRLTGRAIALACEAVERKQRTPNYQLGEAMVDAGIVTTESAVFTNSASNVGIQALLSDAAFMNQFEGADWMDLADGLIASDLYDFKPSIPFLPDAGQEVRFGLNERVDPIGDGDLFVPIPGKSAIQSVKVNMKFDSCHLREMAVEHEWEMMQINALKARGIDYVGIVGEFIGDLFNRRFSKRVLENVDNTGRQYNAEEVTEDAVAGNLVSSNSIVVDGVTITYPSIVNGEAVDYPVTDIIRLTMDQPTATGTDVLPRLIVKPEDDWYQGRNGLTVKGKFNDHTFTMPDDTIAVIGDLDNFGRIVPAFPGQVPNCAFDYNNCLLVCAAGLNVSGANLPEDLTYSYVPLLADGGNLVELDFTTPEELDEADHINNILNTITANTARVAQERNVRPRVLGGSLLSIEGLLTRARRWQSNFNQVGSILEEQFEDYNWKGKISGGPRMWATTGRLLGGNGVFFLTAPGATKVVFGEKMTSTGRRYVDLTGAAENDPVKSTTGEKELFRQTVGIKAPRVRYNDTRKAWNEVTLLFKVKGATAIA